MSFQRTFDLPYPAFFRAIRRAVEMALQSVRNGLDVEPGFREVADTAPAILWLTDTNNRCVYLNRGWYEYTGQTEKEALGSGWLLAVHPGDREQAARSFARAAQQRQAFSTDYRLRRADGRYRWVVDSGRPRFDDAGAWAGYTGSVTDIHERRLAEDALGESQKRLSSVLDHVPVLIGYVDRDGYYRFANAEYEAWFGVRPEEIIGRHMRDVLGPVVCEQRSPFFEQVLRNETVTFEGPTVHKGLGLRDTELVYVPDADPSGHVRGFYVRVVDITERKEAESALRRQSERLRILWEAAAVLLTSTDPDTMLKRLFERVRGHLGVDTYFNFVMDEAERCLRMVSYGGIPESEARRINRLELGQAVCGTVALEQRPIIKTFIQESDDPKVQLVKGYGIRVYACNPLIAEDRLLGTLSFASRTRDAFSADELEFIETLTRYVTAAYQQLRLISQLTEADRKKDEFLAILAHELRNPLAPIRTGLHVLEVARDDKALAAKAVAIMNRQTVQLTHLIDDLMDVARITRGKLQLRKEEVELREVVESAVDISRSIIDEAGHRLTVSLPEESVKLLADSTRLAQVLVNLLSNAAKYTPPRGEIRLMARVRGDEVHLSVADNGIGIPAEMLSRVFEKFLQIHPPATKSGSGVGIGLTLVKSLVELHGGVIDVRSDGADRGSEFVVRLPHAGAGASSDEVSSRKPSCESRKRPVRRVLVVDDNQDAVELMKIAVEQLGSEVRTAHDGGEAILVGEQFQPDVVLMDIGMPGMNGYEASARMRERPWGARATLIALTGWGQDDDRRKSCEAGFDHHLVKPADSAAIEALLCRDADRSG